MRGFPTRYSKTELLQRLAWRGEVPLPFIQPCFHRGQKDRAALLQAWSEIPQTVGQSLALLWVDEIVAARRTAAIVTPQIQRTPAAFAIGHRFSRIGPAHGHLLHLLFACAVFVPEDLAPDIPHPVPSRSAYNSTSHSSAVRMGPGSSIRGAVASHRS